MPSDLATIGGCTVPRRVRGRRSGAESPSGSPLRSSWDSAPLLGPGPPRAAIAPALAVVPPFTDTAGHPFAADIEWLRQAEVTGGCAGGRFCPDDLVTRDQMASFLVRAFDLPASATNAFTDDEDSTA